MTTYNIEVLQVAGSPTTDKAPRGEEMEEKEMTIDCSEFERLTGVFLSAQMLETVERVYLWEYRMTGWKDFCEKYKRNEDDIAERIAIMATLDQNERVQQLDYKIKKLKRIEKVAGQFEKAYQQYLDVKNQDEL